MYYWLFKHQSQAVKQKLLNFNDFEIEMMRIEMNRGKHTQYTTSVYHELSIFVFWSGKRQ